MGDVPARENFGFTATGEKVERVTISKGGLTAKVITWGAVIQDLRLDGHQPPLVLGFDKFEDYKYSSYFGATPGRNANRIGGGKFSIDGHEYAVIVRKTRRKSICFPSMRRGKRFATASSMASSSRALPSRRSPTKTSPIGTRCRRFSNGHKPTSIRHSMSAGARWQPSITSMACRSMS